MKTILRGTLIMLVALTMLTGLAAMAQEEEGVLRLPKNLETIEDEAFCGDEAIRMVDVPDGVKSIGSRAFADSGLIGISVDARKYWELESPIEEDTFENTARQGVFRTRLLEDGTLEITDYYGNNTDLVIPAAIGGRKVRYIGDDAFYECAGLQSIEISEGVEHIGERAFSGCTGLESITIPGSVTSIGYEAFAKCSAMTSVTLSEGIKYIGELCFIGCNQLETIQLPGTIDSILPMAFEDCSGLKSIEIPDGVTSIEWGAFMNCTSLQSVIIPGSVNAISGNAFEGCTALTTVRVKEGVKDIPVYAFWGCDHLDEVWLPESIESLNAYAFENVPDIHFNTIKGSYAEKWVTANQSSMYLVQVLPDNTLEIVRCRNTDMTKIVVPETIAGMTVTSIAAGAFCDEFNLIPDECLISELEYKPNNTITEIILPESIKNIDGAFFGCRALTSINIPEGVSKLGAKWEMGESIEDNAEIVYCIGTFGGCVNLESIMIPETVKQIEAGAFSDDYHYDVENVEMEDYTDAVYLKTIYGVKGSSAEKYAKRKKIKFVPVES